MHLRSLTALSAVALLAAGMAGCAKPSVAPVSSAPSSSATPSPSVVGDCASQYLTTVTAGQLTVGAPSVATPPFFTGDDPKVRKGYEAELVYAIADGLGFRSASVMWKDVDVDPTAVVVPDSVDFVIGQLPIDRGDLVTVDYSDPYLLTHRVVVAAPQSSLAKATSLADLKQARLGAGRTQAATVQAAIAPTIAIAPLSSLAAARTALNAGALDGVVLDLPMAERLVDLADGALSIAGALPDGPDDQVLGLAFAQGNPLASCVNRVLADLGSQGVLEELSDRWLGPGLNRRFTP